MIRVAPLAVCLALSVSCTAPAQSGLRRSDSVVKAQVKASAIGADGKQTLTVTLTPDQSWYIYANPVGSETFESNATTLSVYLNAKKLDAKVTYPKGRTKSIEIGKVEEHYAVYEEPATVTAEVQRTPGEAGPLQVRVRVNSCRGGTCLAPGTVVVDVP